MTTVGIIANPASGKDIRRLVAHGSVFDNEEKVNIVRRVLCGLEAVGVERVFFMPESYGIGARALHGIDLKIKAETLSMSVFFRQQDTQNAAQRMAEMGVGSIISLGGDGTNRMIVKGLVQAGAAGDIPLMPISTGTNNVFPMMIEGTIAGIAAGVMARGISDDAAKRVARIDVLNDALEAIDLALIDAVVYAERFIAARAIWEANKIRELVLTRVEGGNIGLSSIGSHLMAGQVAPGNGLHVRTGGGGQRLLAPIAPGLILPVPIRDFREVVPGEELPLQSDEACVLALDGERELEVAPKTKLYLRLNPNGPRVVDPRVAIELAVRQGFFISA